MSCLYGEGSVSLIGHGGGGLFYHRGGILHVALVVGGVMTEAGCYDWAYEEMFLEGSICYGFSLVGHFCSLLKNFKCVVRFILLC